MPVTVVYSGIKVKNLGRVRPISCLLDTCFDTCRTEIQQLSLSQDGGINQVLPRLPCQPDLQAYKSYLQTRLAKSTSHRRDYLSLSRGLHVDIDDISVGAEQMLENVVKVYNSVARSRVLTYRGKLQCPLTTCQRLAPSSIRSNRKLKLDSYRRALA